MNYTEKITAAIESAAKLARNESEIEDAAHIYRQKVSFHAKNQVEEEAKKHAETAVFDGRKFDTHNPAIALEWAHFLSIPDAIELRDDYDRAFFSYAPNVYECNKCEKDYTEKTCPTCENRRFESDHAKGKI